MRINSQLPLIHDSSRRFALQTADNTLSNGNATPPQEETGSRRVQPISQLESLDLARSYSFNTLQADRSLDRRGTAALSAYASHTQQDRREYLSSVLGIDTYA